MRSPYRFSAAVIALAAAIFVLWASSVWAVPATVVYSGPSTHKRICLTFDDNFREDRALAVLRALQKNQVPATLFPVGAHVANTPSINSEILRGMSRGLFEVGDHSWSHPIVPRLSAAEMARQIGGGADAFRTVTGARTVPLFRPPYGSTNAQVAAVAGSEGFKHLVLWDIDPKDWQSRSAANIANHVIKNARDGSIVVMHLTGAHTAAAIPLIVSDLRAKGFEFVTVSTLLKGDRLFLDVDTGTASGQAVAHMVSQGYMSGYDGNYFGPTDTITRAQAAKVVTLAGGLHTDVVERAESPSFADVRPQHASDGTVLAYPFDFVEEAAAAGLVVGAPGPNGAFVFRPNEPITRVQLAQVLARMARQLKSYGSTASGPPTMPPSAMTFTDVPQYAAADVALVTSLGLMTGFSAQTFSPWAGAQRAHVAVAMSRYLELPAMTPSMVARRAQHFL